MASYGIESGSVNDRTFNAGGYARAFMDWVVKTPANHGPGWYLYHDQSGLGTNPFIVVCNQSAPTANSKAVFLKLTVLSASETINVDTYLTWDTVTGTGTVNFQLARLTTQSNSFAYYFRGGSDFMMLIARIGSSVSHFRLSGWTGIWNGSKGMEPETASGVLAGPAFVETDPGGYLSSYHLMTGYKASLDASGKLYFSIVLVSGSTYRIDVYKDSARTQLVAHTANFTNTTTGAKTLTADNASGIAGTITADITVAAAADIECRFNRLDLGAGQGATFTALRRYFLIDLSQASGPIIRYFKVESIVGDQLLIDNIGPAPALAGAYISPFPHRWLTACTLTNTWAGQLTNTLPYVPSQGGEFPGVTDNNKMQIGFDVMDGVLSNVNPDDDQEYPLQRPWFYPSGSQQASRRLIGYENNIRFGANGSLNAFTDRRIVNGIPYLCVTAGNPALLVKDQEALS